MRRESLQNENIFVNAKMKQNAEKKVNQFILQ